MAKHPSGKTPPQAITHLWPRHREMMYRLVAGETQKAISISMHVSQTRLSIIVNSPLFKKEFSKLEGEIFDNVVETRGDISARIKDLQPKALTVVEDIMLDKKVGKALRRQCANDILELGQKGQRPGEDDGLNHFARVISEAFKMAETAQESNLNGDTNGDEVPQEQQEQQEGQQEEAVMIQEDAVIDVAEAKAEAEAEEDPTSVEEILTELGIME